MRGLEAMTGVLLIVASMIGLPFDALDDLHLPDIPGEDEINETVKGQAVFEAAEYSGSSQVHAQEAALWSEGSWTLTIEAEQASVREHEWGGAATHTSAAGIASWHVAEGTESYQTTSFEDASIEIDVDPTMAPGILSLWPNEDADASSFELTLDEDEPPTIQASSWGTEMWMRYDNEYSHEIDGPVFALGHQEAQFQDAFPREAHFDQLDATGALDLTLFGGTVTVNADGEERVYETGREAVQQDAGAAGESTVTTERVFAAVSLLNATVTATFEEDPETVFLAPEPTWHINGSLRFDAAEGQMSAGENNATLDDDTVTLLGNTTLDLEALGEPDEPGEPNPDWYTDNEAPPTRAQLGSEAESLSVNGESVSVPDPPAIPEEVTFWGQLLGLLLIAWSLVKKVPPFLAALLARDPLKNDRRQRIYEFIEGSGMAYPRMISRALGIPFSSVSYHLRVLREAGIVIPVEKEGYTVYFACDVFDVEDKERLALLACSTREEIAEVLAERGRASQADLVDELGLAQSTIAGHLSKMAEADLVDTNGNHGIAYKPSQLLEEWMGGERRSTA